MSPSPSFSERDPARLRAFVRRHPFATIVVKTKDPVPVVAHVPCLLDDEPAPWGTLRFHVGLSNPIVAAIHVARPVLAVFHGPDGYVSPSWYRDPVHHVPTWNYAVVHAYGRALALSQRADAARLLADLSREHEGPEPAWTFGSLDATLREELIPEIAYYRVEIARLEGIFKLSQNREPEDRERVRLAFERRGRADDREMAAEMGKRAPMSPP